MTTPRIISEAELGETNDCYGRNELVLASSTVTIADLCHTIRELRAVLRDTPLPEGGMLGDTAYCPFCHLSAAGEHQSSCRLKLALGE